VRKGNPTVKWEKENLQTNPLLRGLNPLMAGMTPNAGIKEEKKKREKRSAVTCTARFDLRTCPSA